jgi:hypothetical protein
MARGALSVPHAMEGDHTYDMALAISVVNSLAQLHNEVATMVCNGTFHDQEHFRVSASLLAAVTPSEAFDITPIAPSETFLADGGSSWRWQVIAKRSGEQKIQVILNVRIKAAGPWRYVTSYSEIVTVHVGPWAHTKAFAVTNWQW